MRGNHLFKNYLCINCPNNPASKTKSLELSPITVDANNGVTCCGVCEAIGSLYISAMTSSVLSKVLLSHLALTSPIPLDAKLNLQRS